MNKNMLFSLVGATALIGFSACQNDDLLGDVAAGQQTTVTFSAQLPGAVTRAYGDDAACATQLQYIVYSGETIAVEGTAEITPGVATNVQVDLVSGQAYEIYFWADKGEGSPYTFSGKQVSIDYTGAANDAERDAFFAKKSFTASATTEAVTLTRPFAQLNIGTSDYTDELKNYFTIKNVTVETKAYSTLDLSGDEIIGSDEKAVEFTAAIPADGQAFPISGYDYLAMNYLFQTDAEDVVITITPDNGTEIVRTVASVPFKTNYRTNIAGKLLTQSQGFEVTIDQIFAKPSTDISVWDGTSQEPASYNEETNTYEIATGSQLAWFAAAVNGTLDAQTRADIDYTKADFTLTSNVDLGGNEWTPIGTSSKKFAGSFDGNGHTISNLKISRGKTVSSDNNNAALFAFTTGKVEIKNFTLHNVDITGGARVAGVIAWGDTNEKIENVRLTGKVNIAGATYVGGLGGYQVGHASNIVIDVEPGSKISSDCGDKDYAAYVGGVIGHINGGAGVYENIQSNIDVEGNSVHVGGILGIAYAGHVFNNCHVTGNVSKTGNPTGYDLESTVNSGKYFDKRTVGGIAGVWINGEGKKPVTITNCSFKGQLSNNDGGVDDGFYAHGLGLIGSPYDQQAATTNLVIDYNLATAQQLQLLASAVKDTKESFLAEGIKDTPKTFEGETINLVADVDLAGIEWTPIGYAYKEGIDVNPFKGNFYGNNHLIKNLTNIQPNDRFAGFFGITKEGTIKDLVFENATVEGYLFVGVCAGYPYTSKYSNITVTGDVKVNGYSYVGGMFGKYLYASASNLTVNVNKGSYVEVESGTDRGYCGGLVGFMGEGDNIVVKEAYSNIEVRGTASDIGGLVGIAHYGNTFENCTVEANVTLKNGYTLKTTSDSYTRYLEIGGIAGTWHNETGHKVSFNKCSYKGTLYATDMDGNNHDVYVNANNLIAGYAYSPIGTGELYIDGVKVAGGVVAE